MKTVNSLSGGKTSSYIAIHYPADYNVFALVHSTDKRLQPEDKGLVKRVSDKIGFDFIGTLEADKTLRVVLDLEQRIGQEITWVTGKSFDDVIRDAKAIPNKMWRFCTTEMKMRPIFKWWLQTIGEKVDMRIGFRLDEFERAEHFTTKMKYRASQNTHGQKRYNWNEIEWRVGSFPLIDDRITHRDIVRFWRDDSMEFPRSSNCVGCFWKSEQELRQNWDDHPKKMKWFSDMEQELGNTFRTGITFDEIRRTPKQSEMFFGGGSCQSEGYCTD